MRCCLAVVEAGGLLEVGGGVAAALFEAGERGGGGCGGLLELFALAAEVFDLLGEGRRGWPRGCCVRLRSCGFLLPAGDEVCFWLRASRLRSVARAHSCRRRSMRAASDSIWRRAAPELADSRSASRRSWFLPSMVAGELGDLCCSSMVLRVGLGEFGFCLLSFCWTSASSRLRASGPCARGRPPVTVTLWKVSPVGERKKAWGFDRASERAVSESGATKPSRSLGRMTSSDLPKPSRTRMQSLSGTTPSMPSI